MAPDNRDFELHALTATLRMVRDAVIEHEDEPARVVATVIELLRCDPEILRERRRSLGVAFGMLATWNVPVARGLEPLVFEGRLETGPSPAWEAWLVWSNPVLPAARILRRRYQLAVERLPSAPDSRDVPPALRPDCRLGVHLLLLVLFAPEDVGDFSGLAERFLLEAEAEHVVVALRAAALAASRALDASALERLQELVDRASGASRATPPRCVLLRQGPGTSSFPAKWALGGLPR